MKKLFIFTFAMLAVMALALAPIYACGGDKASTTKADVSKTDAKLMSSSDNASCNASKTSAKLASDKASCASKTSAKLAGDKASCASTTSAKLAGDKASCASTTSAKLASDKAACAAACASKGASLANAEDCAKLCSKSSEVRVVSIEGMTCGGCEESIKSTLANAPGVLKVISVSYQDGIALVAVDKNKVCTTTMAKMVTDKGYKAEVIPAVASTTGDTKANAESM